MRLHFFFLLIEYHNKLLRIATDRYFILARLSEQLPAQPDHHRDVASECRFDLGLAQIFSHFGPAFGENRRETLGANRRYSAAEYVGDLGIAASSRRELAEVRLTQIISPQLRLHFVPECPNYIVGFIAPIFWPSKRNNVTKAYFIEYFTLSDP